jgi:hypothetical protein
MWLFDDRELPLEACPMQLLQLIVGKHLHSHTSTRPLGTAEVLEIGVLLELPYLLYRW